MSSLVSTTSSIPAVPPRFDVCHPGVVLRAVLCVQLALVSVALVSTGTAIAAAATLGPFAFAGLVGTLTWLWVVCLVERFFGRLSSVQRAVGAIGLGAICALQGHFLLIAFELVGREPSRLIGVGLAGALLAAGLWLWLVLRARSEVPANTAARLAELQSRIRPHFLFNTLNAAIALVQVDPRQAENVLEDLAEVFRVALEDHGHVVTLAQEIDIAQRYLAIEQVRFGSRLRVHWVIDDKAGSVPVPSLLLQPLVENAVRHGIEPAPDGGEIVVTTRRYRDHVSVNVMNTVPPETHGPVFTGHGIGLNNVRERLRLLHDIAARFEAKPSIRGFEVSMDIPV